MWHQISFLFFLRIFKNLFWPEDQLWTKTVWFLMCCLPLRQTHTHIICDGGSRVMVSFVAVYFSSPGRSNCFFISFLSFFFFFQFALKYKRTAANFNLLKRKMQSCLSYFFNLSALLISFLSNFVDLSLHCFSSLCKTCHGLFHRPLFSSFHLAVDKS